MTIEIKVGPPQLAVHQGYTVMVSDPDGQILQEGDRGLYFLDTRLISSYALYADGVPWTFLNGGALAASAARVYCTNPPIRTAAGMVSERTLGLVFGRHIDGGMHEDIPGGVDKVPELVGTTTLEDSLRCAKPGGIVCMTGMVGDKWSFPDFRPKDAIPSAVCLTTYDGGVADFMRTPLQELVEQVAAGTLRVQVGRTFQLNDIAEAHRCMEENRAGGKIVVLP